MKRQIQYYTGFPDSPQNRAAITELIELISTHYPEATFEVTAAPEDSQVIHVYATVDLIDTDELVDIVIDRELALQEQGVPIHVIPLRTPERDAEVRAQVAEERRQLSLQVTETEFDGLDNSDAVEIVRLIMTAGREIKLNYEKRQ